MNNFTKWTRLIIYGIGVPALIIIPILQATDCFYPPDIVPHRRHIEHEEDPIDPYTRDMMERENEKEPSHITEKQLEEFKYMI